MLGWIAGSGDDEALRFLHLRPMGSSHLGIWSGRVRAGCGQYFMGTSPLYYLAAAAYRLPKRPAVIGSLGMLWGYLRSALRRAPRYEDREFRRFLRRYQRLCLVLGKAGATRRIQAERAAAWLVAHGAQAQGRASDARG
jgi:hypothetical protein